MYGDTTQIFQHLKTTFSLTSCATKQEIAILNMIRIFSFKTATHSCEIVPFDLEHCIQCATMRKVAES